MNLGPGEVLVLVLASALACAFIARRKGHCVPRWFALGLLFPVVAVLVAVVVPPARTVTHPPATALR